MAKRERERGRRERAAALQQEQKRRERTRTTAIVAAVVVVLVAIVLGGVLLGGGDDSPSGGEGGTGATPKATASGPALVVGDDPSAPVKVVVYEDFLCPYCRQFESATRDFLRRDAEAGKVLVEYRPFHLLQDDYSTRALSAWGAVLQKGTPAQALAFHDALYENQPYEAAQDKPSASELADLAKKAGVKDSAVLDAAQQSDQAFVDDADAAAQKAGVQGTPTVVVDGKELQGSTSELAAQVKQLVEAG